MHKSRLGTLIIDCQTDDLQAAADFWSAALGAKTESSEDQIDQRYVRLEGDPKDPMIILQRVEHPSRIHLDIEADDREAEVARLEKLGATVVEAMERWTIMEAPSGHRFCIIGPIREDFAENANTWE